MIQKLTSFGKTLKLSASLIRSYVSSNRPYFFIGLLASIIAVLFNTKLIALIGPARPYTIGLAGTYTISSLPPQVQDLISIGLTKLQSDGLATGAAAISWQATDSGKKVIFSLRNDLKWQDGQEFNSSQVNYNLKSVELNRPQPNTIEFIFKEPFAPLHTILTQPLFKNGLIGLGEYYAEGLKFNGRFISQINLRKVSSGEKLVYKFYTTEKDLLTALKIRSVDKIEGLHEIEGLSNKNYYQIMKTTEKNTIATLFYNTQKRPFDEKQNRQALTYALPSSYLGFVKAQAPVPLESWFTSDAIKKYSQNFDSAKKTIEKIASESAKLKITIQTAKQLQNVADQIADAWRQIGINVSVEITEVLPESYDVFLTYLTLPPDPDQYSLWHSTQQANISHYKSPKIDKLLEEGRRTLNIADRLDIYANFQKAITEDVPAAFLFYPNIYTLSTK